MENSRKELRYENLLNAYNKLEIAVKYLNNTGSEIDDIQRKINMDAIIQRYEFTFELLWKCLKEYIEYLGYNEVYNGPKGIIKFAFENSIIEKSDATNLLAMLDDRNSTTHLYDEKMAEKIYNNICNNYLEVIDRLIYKMKR